MRYIFFINPVAGKGEKKELRTAIDRYFAENGGEYKVYVTRFAGDAEQLAREEAQKGEPLRIFACGGEGTCYEVINGVIGFDNVEVGVIPCGSANDFLKFFGSRDLFCDISAQLEGESAPMDLIKAGERYCINGCSVGMDAMVARDMHIFKRLPWVGGSLAYKLAIVKVFLSKLGVSINLSIDDKPMGKISCLFAVIANAPFYGGGYMGAPDAVPDDGHLDFTLVDVVSRPKILKFLPLYENGRHGGLDCCTLKTCHSMEFSSDIAIPVNLDGEIVEAKEMRFEIVKKGISFVIPRGVKHKILTKV